MTPCEIGVLLAQTAGEYQEKLTAKGLELIMNQPEEPVRIMADGRHLWRIFDNLMSNICKYSQPSTRVYLSLEHMGGKAVITFKNISGCPLNISSDELMERFVRGDSSRSTEGSGLGLSIAKSLTLLQHGILELLIDGDLFKAILSFGIID
jgi:signal transduction histidine kinase